MQTRHIGGLVGFLISIGSLAAIATMAPPQAPSPRLEVASAIPRASDGKPDLSGYWEAMNTANYDVEAHSARSGVPGGLGVVVDGAIPYQHGAVAQKAENARNRATADTEAKCFLPGVPRIMYMPFPFRIVQTPQTVLMFFEYLHATRNIYLNTPHLRGPLEFWMGDSRGRWEGDTLVVDVLHFNDQTWFDRAGNFHSTDLHVVERYTLSDRDHITYTATIDDPTVFTRPWTMSMVLYRHTEPHFQLLDYECYAFELDNLPIVPSP